MGTQARSARRSAQSGNPASLTEAVAGVHSGISTLPPTIRRAPLATLRRWYRNSLLRLLVSEGIAVPRRMEWIRQIREVERFRGKDSIRRWIDEGGGPLGEIDACIEYMRHMETLPRWVSIFEANLASRAWRAGWESGSRTCKQQNQG